MLLSNANSTISYLSKGNENSCPHKGFHTNVYSNFTCNIQNATQLSSNRRIDKPNVVRLVQGNTIQ